jgi:hypothetical protein
MGLDLFEERGVPLDQQQFNWRELVQLPFSKLDDDAMTRVRIILMNGIESEAVRFSHACARMNGELQADLATGIHQVVIPYAGALAALLPACGGESLAGGRDESRTPTGLDAHDHHAGRCHAGPEQPAAATASQAPASPGFRRPPDATHPDGRPHRTEPLRSGRDDASEPAPGQSMPGGEGSTRLSRICWRYSPMPWSCCVARISRNQPMRSSSSSWLFAFSLNSQCAAIPYSAVRCISRVLI